MIHDWARLRSIDLESIIHDCCLGIVVLGAIEQHGPHLPLATDLIIGEGLRDRLLDRLDPAIDALVLPSLAIGASQEHANFAGTLSLPRDTAVAMINALGESLARSGLRRVLLLNSHGGNHGVMDVAALDLRRRFGLLVVKASYMRLPLPEHLLSAAELREGLHGGQAETSMMLHLAPDTVDMNRARDFAAAWCAKTNEPAADQTSAVNELLGPAGPASWAWLAEDLNADGVVGRAAQASAELGRELVDHYAAGLARVAERAAGMDWPVVPGGQED